ncbi:HNH endonuclease [Pseudomonas sp. Pseusp122]|uniref:HNH endonuclease n=1 Tax=unclassified Pseudomonas TaxID=196821 RepID=UPI0039A72A2C
MKYWWVNHKQTSKHEIAGGFLWSPMRKANGKNNKFYENMRLASPGDAVMSFSHAKIQHVGRVTEFAFPSPKPPSFGNAGEYWSQQGWLLPVKWERLIEPVRPKSRITELRSILPLKYSPIHPATGNGGQNAYLAEVSKSVFDLLMGTAKLEYEKSSFIFPALKFSSDIDDYIQFEIIKDQNLDSTTKKQLIDARRGQGIFKKNILQFEKACRLTHVTNSGLLIASHIKPWRLCDNASERLDGANGLLLTPSADFLFDRGLISFCDDGSVLVSSRLCATDLKLLGFDSARDRSHREFDFRQRVYLKFHRDNVFMP